jgi:predicted NUDIX family NTP pyrophosphohydrolase
LLLYRQPQGGPIQVLLGHPGGPFWADKDLGAWSLPKGEVEPGEDLLRAARRETLEETGFAPDGPFHSLGEVTLKSGKIVHAWAALHDGDPRSNRSNLVEMEWPPRSGRRISFPEIDRVDYFDLEEARTKLNPGQVAFLDRLAKAISSA